MNSQYDTLLDNIKKDVSEKGYDLELTMESFLDKGKPLRSADFLDFVVTYMAIKDYYKRTGKGNPKLLSDQTFVTYTMGEDSITESKPFKITEYEKNDDGLYEVSGYRYSTVEETVGIYKEVKDGLYEKTGTEKVEPESKKTLYGTVSVNVIKPEDLYEIYEVDAEEIEDEIAERKAKIQKEINGDEVRSSVLLTLPEFDQSTSWNQILAEKISSLSVSENGNVLSVSETIKAIAESFIGQLPYEWGGKPTGPGYDPTWWTWDSSSGTQNGLDCSGFVQLVYLTAGYDASITSQMQSTVSIMASNFEFVSEAELQPGDIGVVERATTNHTGIYAGNGEWIHCSSAKNTVVKANYKFTKFYRPTFTENTEVNLSNINNCVVKQEDSEIELLAKTIAHEAGSEGLNGWIAVAEVIRNRILSNKYPNTVSEVVYQPGQFSSNEEIAGMIPNEEIRTVAREVLAGRMSILNNSDVLYFRNPTMTSGISSTEPVNWGNHQYYIGIGHHAFYIN